jgi:hypothetical protein
LRPWRQEVQRHREDQVNHQDQDSNEPRRPSAVGHQGGADPALLKGLKRGDIVELTYSRMRAIELTRR